MKVTWNKVLWFVAGIAVGVAVTNHFFKTKYERLYQEDVESVKRAFSTPLQSEPPEDTVERFVDGSITQETEAYEAIINSQGYGTATDNPVDSIGKEVKGVSRPYVISPADFDTEDGYEVYSLTYFADGTLVDEQNNPIEDVDEMVGRDSLNHFGEYEDYTVHVRNKAQMCDFEITYDLRNYSDVFRNGPRPDED